MLAKFSGITPVINGAGELVDALKLKRGSAPESASLKLKFRFY
jgi:hypothetical protein